MSVINLNKPAGITSHDAVAQIRRIFGVKKVGHAGTLDPFATGVLVIAIGSATRLLEYATQTTKTYEAEITLGATSDTDDLTGTIIAHAAALVDQTKLEEVLKSFVGTYKQTPPMYSAVKIQGKKLYEYARAKVTMPVAEIGERRPPITVHEITLLNYSWPHLNVRIDCSSGTYIRALARDIGQALQTGGYVSSLCRTRSGSFTVGKSVSLLKLSTTPSPSVFFDPDERLVAHLSAITLDSANVAKLKQGKEVVLEKKDLPDNQPVALYTGEQRVFGIGDYNPVTRGLSPRKILAI